jgi:uncharacterized protein (TIGR01244 family)
MDIRPLTSDYAVSPQILPEDMAALRAAGFVAVIDNRPDGEIPPELHAGAMQAAAEAAGLAFHLNPLVHGTLSLAHVEAQREAMAAAGGPVLAYCASGNRSSVLWALAMAGMVPTADLIAAARGQGYDLSHLAAQIDALAGRG